jgi:hypothetical protein
MTLIGRTDTSGDRWAELAFLGSIRADMDSPSDDYAIEQDPSAWGVDEPDFLGEPTPGDRIAALTALSP